MLVDKPPGLTSHDVVLRVRRVLRTRAVGHTGTLDPFATGLLVVLVGRATRLARFVESESKTYLATARLGVSTDTDDATGAELSEPADISAVSEPVVRTALAGFLGAQRQRPPRYSAKHVDGERSYRLARDHQSMPARSKKQQMAAGAALAAKRGKKSMSSLKGPSKQMAKSMSKKQLKEFAGTKRKKLPRKKRSK